MPEESRARIGLGKVRRGLGVTGGYWVLGRERLGEVEGVGGI